MKLPTKKQIKEWQKIDYIATPGEWILEGKEIRADGLIVGALGKDSNLIMCKVNQSFLKMVRPAFSILLQAYQIQQKELEYYKNSYLLKDYINLCDYVKRLEKENRSLKKTKKTFT